MGVSLRWSDIPLPDLNVWAYDLGFMSSVDLHTHSGFQRMLPESFAVVCAPNSTPRYGFPAGGSYQLLIVHSAFVQLRRLPLDGHWLTNYIRMPSVTGISPTSRSVDIYCGCPLII